jgi:hypothetical protein
MKTMNTIEVVRWLVGREEILLAERISYLFSGSTVVDTEKLRSLFYLTLGSNLGPSLFREMQCEVTTLLTLETE